MAGESARAAAPRHRARAEALLRSADGFERAQRVRRAPPGRWPPCRSWTGASSTTCTGPAVATPTSTTWWSAPAGSSSSTRRPGPATSRWPTACCGRTGTDASGTSWPRSDAAMAVAELVPGLDPTTVKPVLCFDREEPVFGWSHEVMVCSTVNVATLLTSRPAVAGRRDAPRHRRVSCPVAEGGHRPDRPGPTEAAAAEEGPTSPDDEETPEPDPIRGHDPRSRPRSPSSSSRWGCPGSPRSSRTRPATGSIRASPSARPRP